MAHRRTPEAWGRSEGSAPRVLIEHADQGVACAAERVLDRQGYSVAVCGGPEHLRGGRCPLVTTGRCALVDGADVVVHGLDLADADNRAVLGAIRRLRPERRVVVEATASGSRDHHEVLEGCAVLPFPMRTGTLVDAIEHALDPR